jgi:hypothetical protein
MDVPPPMMSKFEGSERKGAKSVGELKTLSDDVDLVDADEQRRESPRWLS